MGQKLIGRVEKTHLPLLVALLNVADDLLRRRIHRGERLARRRFPELIVDEHLCRLSKVYHCTG